MQGKLE